MGTVLFRERVQILCVIEICVESFAASQGVGFSIRLYIVIIYPSSEKVLFDHIQ